jgi:NAD(P)-dependent dehydrogenase (short-subunit alcohol dehydrogenase family)
MARLGGKIALITGGASVPGLGSATAQRFAEEGATVYVTDVDFAGAQSVAETIRRAGGRATALAHDVTSEAEWDRVIATVIKQDRRLDVLVNNAGIAVLKMLDAVTSADVKRLFDVNLASVIFGTQRAVREMRRVGEGGSIINMSSVAGLVGVPGCTAYAATKGGVRLFTKTAAVETAREKIRVNSVHPGVIWTNMQKSAFQDNADNVAAITAGIPCGFLGEPLDIANAVLFLASDEARYITGAEIVVDGGMTAQ